MAGLSIWHVLIFAIVVILLFGTSKLKNLGKDVGGAIKDFKNQSRMKRLNRPSLQSHVPLMPRSKPLNIRLKVKSSLCSILE